MDIAAFFFFFNLSIGKCQTPDDWPNNYTHFPTIQKVEISKYVLDF